MAQESDQKPVVTYLGPQASYTHQAALSTFNTSDYALSPQITIEDVFASVQDGTAHRGVVPFENSSNGSVVFTLDLFADLNAKYPDILVCGESYIAVSHCLLGHNPHLSTTTSTTVPSHLLPTHIIESPLSSGAVTPTTRDPAPAKPTARPLADISRITTLYSHPQAWGQCKAFLNTYLKGAERHDVSSTSRAAEIVAGDASGASAAISSVVAAGIHGVDVLARGIEDRGDNTTRFFVIKRKKGEGDGEGETGGEEGEGEWKSLVSFTVEHGNPGALAKSLKAFERFGINVTSINTRPSGVENWNYIFFVEIKGRRRAGEGSVDLALKELDTVCRGWRWLGSWENRLGK
ncbi:PDT domain-containing protein [Aaosphaeria arxii CBS 175.79]|uniref:prephenate dehydratase n=1 Tax=Aaosphaeria arxii CBS 175.79 TaxID=1450172 RepID=A0A6A5XKL9_9PLEO|nr:PDT domain-containing protein [Aaosphaeria arxii CBS 175.79]KAF2012854.1 PDT domain-containing protein [Aaosphaeria arxii CBS 175.79]